MSNTLSVSSLPGPGRAGSLRAAYLLTGAVAGLAIGIAVLLVVAAFYGQAMGLSPGACALFACSLTVLLSQPAGLAGMVAGAMVGAVTGAVVSHKRRLSPEA